MLDGKCPGWNHEPATETALEDVLARNLSIYAHTGAYAALEPPRGSTNAPEHTQLHDSDSLHACWAWMGLWVTA